MIDTSKAVKHLAQTPIYRIFLKDVCRYPVLTDVEMEDCLAAAHSGNPEVKRKAVERIVNHNQLFVVMVARKWATDDNLMDLISEGNLGLIHAIDLYKPTFGVKFLSYAVNWVEAAIRTYVTRMQPTVTPPAIHRMRVKVNRAVERFLQDNQRMPSIEEIKEIVGDDVHAKLESLSDLVGCSTVQIDDTVEADSFDAEKLVKQDDWEFVMTRAFGVLNDRERRVISMTFGIGEYKDSLTMAEAGKLLGLSSERVRQIRVRALDKMKEGVSQCGLVDAPI